MKQSMKHFFFFLSMLLTAHFVTSQTIVTERTFKIAGMSEEFFLYGFAEGDEIIIDFEELKGKPLKEFEIIEYPNSSRFMEYKVSNINGKKINIQSTGIYKFRFANSAISGKICKIKIQRVPSSLETTNFNTNVYFKNVYDTIKFNVQERYLISRDTIIHNLTTQNSKVHSKGNIEGNRTVFNFTLPNNTFTWSYYIDVNQAGQLAMEEATKKLSQNASPILKKLPGFGPLAALALDGSSYISTIQKGEDIDYFIVDGNNLNLFNNNQPFSFIFKGKVINEARRVTNINKGTYYFCLVNDNAVAGVTVNVSITAIEIKDNIGLRNVEKQKIETHQVPYLKN